MLKKISAFISICSFSFLFLGFQTAFAGPLAIGTQAPNIVLSNILEDNTLLNAEVTSRMPGQSFTLIEFSSTLCGTCKDALPTLLKVAQDNFDVMQTRIVYIDGKVNNVKKFVDDNRHLLKFPIALDPKKQAITAFGATETPTLFVVNDKNTIVYMHVGVMNDQVANEVKNVIR